MSGMHMQMAEHSAAQLPSPHAGSGTAWEPASVPEHEWMLMRGGWELMAHGVDLHRLQPARRAARGGQG